MMDVGASQALTGITTTMPHICVCICTYKRRSYLERLLCELADQQTDDRFTYSVIVADNDHLQSAEPAVRAFAGQCPIPIKYCVEPRQNISLARNRAIQQVDGDFVAFIDDDEIPTSIWLLTLFRACEKYKVDGVLGPVKPSYEIEPPVGLCKENSTTGQVTQLVS